MADRTEKAILEFEVDLGDSVKSIDDLRKANKELTKERNELNLRTTEGQKRLQEINAQLDKNTQKIKSNVSAIEQQKINIGNYKSALDGVHPALGKVGEGLEAGASGFKAMAKSALSFIATPIGAILAGLVVVFGLLKSALSQNDALMDKFENITNAVGVVVQVVTARIGKLGEAFIAFVSLDFDKAVDLTSQAFGGLSQEIGNAVTQQQLFLDASRELEDSQRALRIETSKQENVIKALVVASKNRNLSLDEQEGKLRLALKLEQDLVRQREDEARRDLVITTRRLRVSAEFQQKDSENFEQYVERLLNTSALGGEELDKIAEKVIALEQARGSSLAFQEKVENSLATIQEKRAVALEKQNAALAEQAELERANRRAANQVDTSTNDPLLGAFETQAKVRIDIEDRMQDDLKKRKDAAARQDKERAEKGLEIQRTVEEQKLQAAAGVAAGIAGLLDEQSDAYKAFASAQVIISTYAAATKAYEAAFLPIPTVASPALGVAFAAAAVLQGIANLAKINGVEFAEGGWTGPGRKYDAVGVVHADEYVTPKWLVHSPQAQPHLTALETMRTRGYADGGFVVNSVTQPINQQLELSNIFKNMPPMELSVKEVTKVQQRVRVKENISKR